MFARQVAGVAADDRRPTILPRIRRTGTPVALLAGASLISLLTPTAASASAAPTFAALASQPGVRVVAGDFNADGREDLALIGGHGWQTIPVAFSRGNGTFTVTKVASPSMAYWATSPRAKLVAGDFNADGRQDLALTGDPNWHSIPVAFSRGNGGFSVTNLDSPSMAYWATSPRAKLVTGDFNGDGRQDLALTGDPNWHSIPVAFSRGNGGFSVTNLDSPSMAYWATSPRAKLVTGDFNGDGRQDLALTGDPYWHSIPVAFSRGNGGFSVTNLDSPSMAYWATSPRAKLVAGDFNADGRQDLALTGDPNWHSIPVAFSRGNGGFSVTNLDSPSMAYWATSPRAKLVAGDFNADGRQDLALTGDPNWHSIPVAFSRGNGGFSVTNLDSPSMAYWATSPRAKLLTGDFNGDGRQDLALTGDPYWHTIPVAFSRGNGGFSVSNSPVA